MRDHYHYHVSYSVTFPSGVLTVEDANLKTKMLFNEKQETEFKDKETQRLQEVYKHKVSITCFNEIECDCY